MRALAALLLLAPLLCAAQPGVPVERPDVKVGDRWTYRRMDYDEGKALGTYEVQVVFAQRGVIQLVGTRKYKDEEVDTTYTADWNAVSTAARVFYPHTGWFKFPLQVGDSYKAAYETVIPKKDIKSRTERQVTVVGWEDVVVPAGKFRALKIVSEGRFQRLETSTLSGTSRNVIWYVPQVKRWVKLTRETRPLARKSKGRGEHAGEELVTYRLQ
ncbi:MAG TPA: hypothetical protein VLF42_00690 [Burkholderiales bacterium]|nr:hypothetical protein [Burkholderiales bacterium]